MSATIAFLVAAAFAPQSERTPAPVEIDSPSNLVRQVAPPPVVAALGGRRTILLTGYWPPSNEAVRAFSPNPAQNPSGWIGLNWEGRGYDVYSYFPEFSPPTCTNCGPGTGDLQVDY